MKKRKLWKTAEIHTDIRFSHIFFTACPNINPKNEFEESGCQKSNCLLKCIFHSGLRKK